MIKQKQYELILRNTNIKIKYPVSLLRDAWLDDKSINTSTCAFLGNYKFSLIEMRRVQAHTLALLMVLYFNFCNGYRCEPFPTYPRTYDLVHAEGLLSLEFTEKPRCHMMDMFTEIDRILRPEV